MDINTGIHILDGGHMVYGDTIQIYHLKKCVPLSALLTEYKVVPFIFGAMDIVKLVITIIVDIIFMEAIMNTQNIWSGKIIVLLSFSISF